MTQGLSIAGRKRDDGIDFYQTPEWATMALLERITLDGTTLEPCSGAGAIAKLIDGCVGSDIRNDETVYGIKGKNIFDWENKTFDNIITNPPYKYAQEVIEKSLLIARRKVYMLLKLQFLESVSRYEFFKNSPLKNVYVFCKRVNMYPEGFEQPKNSGTIAYAWYEWEHGYTGYPMIRHIV